MVQDYSKGQSETLSLNKDMPTTLKEETNTKNTTKSSSKNSSVDYYPINQEKEDVIDNLNKDSLEKEKKYRDIIIVNINECIVSIFVTIYNNNLNLV